MRHIILISCIHADRILYAFRTNCAKVSILSSFAYNGEIGTLCMYLGYIRLINQVSKKGWLDDYNNIYTVSTKNIRIEEIL